MGGEIAEEGIFLSSVYGDIATKRILGAFVYVGGKDTSGTAEVVFECTSFGGAGVAFEKTDGDVLGVQRLVECVEQVFRGKMHVLVLSS